MAAHAIVKIGGALFAVPARDAGRIVFVAAIASVGFEIAGLSVAGGAGGIAPPAVIERERMLERRPLPRRRGVALSTVRAKLALMHLRIGVAGGTRLRRALEDIVGVAFGAGHREVRAGQLERRQTVIELGLFPIFRRVALAAVRAIGGLVLVVLAMAVHAALRRAHEIGWGARIGVALVAPGAGVPAR